MTIHSSSKHWDPDVRLAAIEVDSRFPRSDWTSTYPGHGEGSAVGAYAVDYLCNKAAGDKIAAYVWKNRKRLGARYVIWWGEIISETHATRPNVWLPYFNRNATNPDGTPNLSKQHRNHVHVSHYRSFNYRPPTFIDKIVNVVKPPTPPTHQPLISLQRIQDGITRKTLVAEGLDGEQFQEMCNRAHRRPTAFSYVLDKDGILGDKTRRSTALLQVAMINSRGAHLTKDDAWGGPHVHPDCDGIPGQQLFEWMGIDNSDDNTVTA